MKRKDLLLQLVEMHLFSAKRSPSKRISTIYANIWYNEKEQWAIEDLNNKIMFDNLSFDKASKVLSKIIEQLG